MPDFEPLEPTDIWTADGHRVVRRGPGLPTIGPAEVLGALVVAPVAATVLAAGVAVTAGAVATTVAAAAVRSLFGGGPPGAGWGLPDVVFVVVDVRDAPPER